MPSNSHTKFKTTRVAAEVIRSFVGSPSSASGDQSFIDQALFKASVAMGVGFWEGYLEDVLKEFVAKTRFPTHRKVWTLIAQFEAVVDKMTSELNTPNWERARELLTNVTGMDPYSSWVWLPKFANQTDTKEFFDGVMAVRHAFAHGFAVPPKVSGLATPGVLDTLYVADALSCIDFFADSTDLLLEHELKHRHACPSGWN